MRICIFLLASLLSPSLSAPTETDRLPQFLQALPFFSQLQELQQRFQDLQANIPAEVMAQITQNLANLLAAGQQQPAARGLDEVVQEGIQSLKSGFIYNIGCILWVLKFPHLFLLLFISPTATPAVIASGPRRSRGQSPG